VFPGRGILAHRFSIARLNGTGYTSVPHYRDGMAETQQKAAEVPAEDTGRRAFSALTATQQKAATAIDPGDVCLYRSSGLSPAEETEWDLALFEEWVLLPTDPGADYFAEDDMPTEEFAAALENDLGGRFLKEDAALRGSISVVGLGEIWRPQPPVCPSTLVRAVHKHTKEELLDIYGGQIRLLPPSISERVLHQIAAAYIRKI
jgi:hypothetical protein